MGAKSFVGPYRRVSVSDAEEKEADEDAGVGGDKGSGDTTDGADEAEDGDKDRVVEPRARVDEQPREHNSAHHARRRRHIERRGLMNREHRVTNKRGNRTHEGNVEQELWSLVMAG